MAWNRRLSRRLVLRDGTDLVTLGDAAALLLERFEGVRAHAPLEHAIELLMRAEKTGKRADVEAATDQVALVFRQSALLED